MKQGSADTQAKREDVDVPKEILEALVLVDIYNHTFIGQLNALALLTTHTIAEPRFDKLVNTFQVKLAPPSSVRHIPVVHADWRDARNSIAFAQSSTSPIRPRGSVAPTFE